MGTRHIYFQAVACLSGILLSSKTQMESERSPLPSNSEAFVPRQSSGQVCARLPGLSESSQSSWLYLVAVARSLHLKRPPHAARPEPPSSKALSAQAPSQRSKAVSVSEEASCRGPWREGKAAPQQRCCLSRLLPLVPLHRWGSGVGLGVPSLCVPSRCLVPPGRSCSCCGESLGQAVPASPGFSF